MSSNNLRSGEPSWIIGALIGGCAFGVFLRAGDDFSYDYGNYIAYLNRLGDFTSHDLWTSLGVYFPYPYILVPPSGVFELGFALLAWALLASGMGSAWVYALIGAASIAIRVVLLRAMGMGWALNGVFAIYSITLFEANAIRLGVALTLATGELLMLMRGHWLKATALVVASGLFHLQALALSAPVLVIWVAFRWVDRSIATRAITLGAMVTLSVSFVTWLESVGLVKILDYVGQVSGATGFNVISMTALIVLAVGAFVFLGGARVSLESAHRRVWSSVLLSAFPAIAMLLQATSLGAVGDRIWQFAFASLVAVLPLLSLSGARAKIYKVALWTCLAVSVTNVTLRYPLSNFFTPLIPYAPITPPTLIV